MWGQNLCFQKACAKSFQQVAQGHCKRTTLVALGGTRGPSTLCRVGGSRMGPFSADHGKGDSAHLNDLPPGTPN